MREVIENWQGSDEDLLTYLNTPRNKRKVNDGLVTLAMVADVSEGLAGLLAVTMKRVIANLTALLEQLPDGPQRDQVDGQYEIFYSFYKRLTESSFGAPIDSDSFRNQFTAVATQAGWESGQIETFLSLGAVVTSDAFDALGRDASLEDIQLIRADLAYIQLSTDYNRLYNQYVSDAIFSGDKAATIAGLRALADAWEAE